MDNYLPELYQRLISDEDKDKVLNEYQNKHFCDYFIEVKFNPELITVSDEVTSEDLLESIEDDIYTETDLKTVVHLKIPTHRFVLNLYVDYFHTMFNTEYNPESTRSSFSFVDEYHPLVVWEMVVYGYTGDVSNKMNWKTLGVSLFQLANRLLMNKLVELCAQNLREILDQETVFGILELISRFEGVGTSELKNDCFNYIINNYATCQSMEKFNQLDRELLNQISSLMYDKLRKNGLTSENRYERITKSGIRRFSPPRKRTRT